jgi:hypothetical protein
MVVQCQGCNFAAISCRYIEEHFFSRGGDICFDFHVPKCFKLLTFQSRLFQKRFARTKFDIFVFSLIDQHAKLCLCTVLAN